MILKTEKHTKEDAAGNITIDVKETSFKKESEPDYIKLYTQVWCEFNQIPDIYRALFLELIQRMSYCNSNDLEHSQLVYTGEPVASTIMNVLKWKRSMYQKGLRALTDAGAIRRVARGLYQVNPNYAGKGGWRYDARLKQGGIKDLVATFDFKNKKVDTKIIWADDGTDSEINQIMRNGMNVKDTDSTILQTTKLNSDEQEAS